MLSNDCKLKDYNLLIDTVSKIQDFGVRHSKIRVYYLVNKNGIYMICHWIIDYD